MLPISWEKTMLKMDSRSFQNCTVGLCRSKGYKDTSCQNWRFEKKFCLSAGVKPHECGQVSSPRQLDHPWSLTGCNFAALWPTDFLFPGSKDLNLSKKCTRNQEAGSILKIIFAHSKWPHLHRVYLIRV